MPLTDLLMEGVNLLLLGMGSVFVFLATLVLAMNGMSHLARRIEPEQLPLQLRPAAAPTARSDLDDEIIVVISAAVRHYRS
jgi:oxaloacetate decarboxylase gamma subunit